MRQRYKGLPQSSSGNPDMVLYHRQTAGITVLIAQTLENPLGRVALLHRSRPVSFQDRIDHRQRRVKIWRSEIAHAMVFGGMQSEHAKSQPAAGS